MNPKGPHRGNNLPIKNVAVPIPQTEEWLKLIKNLKTLAVREDASDAHIYRNALIEYHNRHFPGNPALPLTHWTKDEPLSEAAEEKLSKESSICPEKRSMPDYGHMNVSELEAALNKRFLPDFEQSVIRFFLKRKRRCEKENE